MLSPNDIANMKFEKAMGRGYKSDAVDQYLRQVADDYKALLAEKQEIEQKLMVLAEKLEEYKGDEDSMRSALIGAQKLGDSVIRDAKTKASMILDEANLTAKRLVDNAKKTIEREQSSFVRMQREVATFKSKLQLVYKQHLEMIRTIPVNESLVESAIEETKESQPLFIDEPLPVESYAQTSQSMQIDDDDDDEPETDLLQQDDELPPVDDEMIYEDGDAPLEYETVSAYSQEPKESRFGPLKFGKEYDIKRDDKRKK